MFWIFCRKSRYLAGRSKCIRSCYNVQLLLLNLGAAWTSELRMVEEAYYTNTTGMLVWLFDSVFISHFDTFFWINFKMYAFCNDHTTLLLIFIPGTIWNTCDTLYEPVDFQWLWLAQSIIDNWRHPKHVHVYTVLGLLLEGIREETKSHCRIE